MIKGPGLQPLKSRRLNQTMLTAPSNFVDLLTKFDAKQLEQVAAAINIAKVQQVQVEPETQPMDHEPVDESLLTMGEQY